MAETRRNDIIDGFRAFAIFIVLCFHYLVRWTYPLNNEDYYGYSIKFSKFFRLGEFGVHIFFVISGLVIAMTIMRSNSVPEFLVKRIARLYPAYLVGASLVALVLFIFPAPFKISMRDYLSTLSMAAPHLGANFVDGAYWSLLVEVKFYFWVAISFWFLREKFWIGILLLGLVG